MAEPVGALRVELSANAAQFEKDMGKARDSVRNSTKSMTSSFDGFRRGLMSSVSALLSLRSAAIAAAGVGAFGLLVKKTLDAAGALVDTADKIGITTGKLQEYRYAAEQSGMTTDELDSAVSKFSRNMGDLGKSSSETQTTLKDLNPELLRTLRSTNDVSRQLDIAVDGLAAIENPAKRGAVAVALFGRSGQAMVNMANDARKLRDEARALGLVVEDSLLRNAESAGDKLDTLAKVLGVQMTNAVLKLAPQIQQLAENLIRALPAMLDFIQRGGEMIGVWDKPAATRMLEIAVEMRQLSAELATATGPAGGLLSVMTGGQDPEFIREKIALLTDEYNRLADSLKASQRGTVVNNITPMGDDSGPDIAALKERKAEFERAGKAIESDWVTHLEEMKKINDEFNDSLIDMGRAIRQEIETPLEHYNAKVVQLNIALRTGVISQDEFTRAMEKAEKTYKDNDEQLKKNRELVNDLGLTFTSAFEDAVVSGGKLSDILQGLEQDLLRLALRKTITEPLFAALGGVDWGGMFSFGSGAASTAPTYANSAMGPASIGYANGGAFTVGGVAGTDKNLVQFRATKGERVTIQTPGQMDDGGAVTMIGGDVQVNVYAPEGSKTETRESQGPGGRTIDVIIDEAVAKNIGTPGSRTGRALNARFGATPKLNGR